MQNNRLFTFKAIIGVIIYAFLSTGNLQGQTVNQYASAKIYDGSFAMNANRIVITYGNSKTETIPLLNFTVQPDLKAKPISVDSILGENLKIINQFYADMEDKGYEIVQLSSSNHMIYNTYVVFRKPD